MTETDPDAPTKSAVRRRRFAVLGLVAVVVGGSVVLSRGTRLFGFDVKRATVAELIDAIGESRMPLTLPGSQEHAAGKELLARGTLEVDAEIERASLDASADRRVAAVAARAVVIEHEETARASARRPRHVEKLLVMLDDRDVAVRTRAFAASVFALRWPAVTPPPRWFEVARELIESADRVHRWSAALGAMQLGERAQPLVPALLARVRHESDGGLRWMIAAALGRTRTGDEEVIRLLTAWLGDADVQVRWAAASAVGELGATAAIPSLFALARDSGVTEDVLRSAVAALAKLVSRAADVDAVLELLGEQQPRLEQYELIGWCDQVALAATACPTASCVRDARERLRTVQRLDGSLAGDAALSASVRIAAAARDELPSAADVDRLWEAARGGDPDYFMSEAQMPACEALVALAHWPESGVSAATLRQLLERAGDGQPGFVRADIDRLLARLPR